MEPIGCVCVCLEICLKLAGFCYDGSAKDRMTNASRKERDCEKECDWQTGSLTVVGRPYDVTFISRPQRGRESDIKISHEVPHKAHAHSYWPTTVLCHWTLGALRAYLGPLPISLFITVCRSQFYQQCVLVVVVVVDRQPIIGSTSLLLAWQKPPELHVLKSSGR